MRVMLLLAGALAALALLLAGCGGDDEQQQAQSVQQAQAQAEQERAAARPQPAQGQQSAQAQVEDAQQAVESRQEESAAQVEGGARFDDPLLEAAFAAFTDWSEGLESIVLDVEADFNLAGLAAQMSATVSAQFEPLTILTTIDATQLLAMFGDAENGAANGQEELLLMAILMTEEGVFLTMPSAEGWIDLTNEGDGVLEGLTGILGGDPSELRDPAQLGQAFGCVEAVGGVTTVGRHAGEPVWIVDCAIDMDAVSEAAAEVLEEEGIEFTDAGIEAMGLRLTISQASGAPLLVETEMVLLDAFGLPDDEDGEEFESQFYINTVTELRSWNEPIDFPAPEPLVDGSLIDAFSGSADDDFAAEESEPPELLDAEELIDLASDSVAGSDEMELEFVAEAVIDGESRLAATSVRRSRSQGAFETVVKIDDGRAFRLLWNRDGIWVSDSEEDGQPIWTPSDPAQLGFAGQTVDEFLAEAGRLDLEALRPLLGVSWVTRTIEGGRPPVYELVIEGGYLVPGEPNFDQIVGMLKADTAELLAENVSVEQIDYFSVVITLMGSDGEVVSRVTEAEFVTNAGPVELLASLSLVSDGPIEFSRPEE